MSTADVAFVPLEEGSAPSAVAPKSTSRRTRAALVTILGVAAVVCVVLFSGSSSSSNDSTHVSVSAPNYPGIVGAPKKAAGDVDPFWGTPTSLDFSEIGQISTFMNTSADPCSDFYNYACGGWLDQDFSQDPYVYSFNTIATKVQQQLSEALRNGFPGHAGLWFTQCMDTDGIDARGTAPLTATLKKVSSVTDLTSFLAAVGQLQHDGHATGALSDFFVQGDLKLGYKNDFFLMPWGVSAEYQFLQPSDLVPIVTKAFEAAGMSSNDAAKAANNVADVENTLWNAWGPVITKVTSAAELFGMAETVSYEDFKTQTGIDIKQFVDALSGEPRLASETFATWTQGGFWPALQSAFNAEKFQDYLRWHIIFSQLDFLPSAFRDVADDMESTFGNRAPIRIFNLRIMEELRPKVPWSETSHQQYHSQLRATLRHPKATRQHIKHASREMRKLTAKVRADRSQFCSQSTMQTFLLLVEHKWIVDSFPAGNKDLAQKLVDKVIAQMTARLEEVSWLDDATRAAALRKVKAIVANVAYDTPWDTLDDLMMGTNAYETAANIWGWKFGRIVDKVGGNVTRDKFDQSGGLTLFDQNAFYDPSRNNINMIAGLMYQPFFSIDQHMALNIAAYAMVIGHEITHGFDNNGRHWGPYGGFENWWTPAAAAEFEKRAQCLIDQYDAFHYDFPDSHVDGKLTLGENIADNGGIGLAFNTYKNYLNLDKPIYDGLTNDQLFFVWHGQSWCAYASDDALKSMLQDVHSPPNFRVRGALSNTPAFAKAFGCKAEDYPQKYFAKSLTADRCEVW